jgi:Uncharacterized protein conserved in bacteria (DUF2169)
MNAATPRLFALNSVTHATGGTLVGVIAKRTYSVRAGACQVADEQVPLVDAPQVDPETDVLVHDLDTALNRSKVDVIVRGKARPHGTRRTFDARVRLGDLDRTIRICGDRRCWRDVHGNIRFSDPAPVDAVDVGWTSAYGGVDEAALARNGDPIEPYFRDQGIAYRPRFGTYAYPRNRAGRGYLVEASPEGLEGCRLPNLEDPAHLLTPERLAVGRPDWWPAGPVPACFGWHAYNYFPRMAMLALVPRFDAARFAPASFAEVRAGALRQASVMQQAEPADRLDVAAAQQSALGMRAEQVMPGSPVELTALHQTEPVWSFAIPVEVPRMAVEISGKTSIELAPRIRTVLLEPDRERLVVTWVGEHVEEIPIGPGKTAKLRFFAKWPA